MPLYEFVCADCGLPFEQLVLSSNTILEATCSACQSQNVTKKISTFASKLSGSSSLSIGSASSASFSTVSV